MDNQSATENNTVPLFVDLDGSLIGTDLLYESFLALLRTRPVYCLLLPFWLLRGKAHLKHKLAQHFALDATSIPYNRPFLDFLLTEAARGRELVLATASNRQLANQIADHIGIFSAVLASDANYNLSGKRKLAKIIEYTGGNAFDYAADARVDLNIWKQARKALLVKPQRGVEKSVKRLANLERIFTGEKTDLMVYLRAIRVYQWMKNLLLFVPLATAHKFTSFTLVSVEVLAFIAFSLCSSGVYVLNDLLDIPADRAHPRKQKRPFAAGTLPLSHGLLLGCLLPLLGLSISLLVSPEFFRILLVYMVLTSAYSIKLKVYAIVDVLLLATLYTLRVFAGAIAIDVTLSFWLLTFSMFIFLSLALVKRCSELVMITGSQSTIVSGRGYQVTDLSYLQIMGISSGYISILVIALYIDNPTVTEIYAQPQLLWILCPALLFWISRVWMITSRGEMHDDPLIFAIKDKVSYITALVCVLAVFLAM